MLICTDEFATLARAQAKTLRMPGLIVTTIPHPFSWSGLTREKIRERAEGVLQQVIECLSEASSASKLPSQG